MKVQLATPATAGTLNGNRMLADRWAAFLQEMGHEVRIESGARPRPSDLLVAVHAKRSAAVVEHYAASDRRRPIVVILAGTDIYGDLQAGDRPTIRSLELATVLVTLQPLAARELDRRQAAKAHVVFQSALPPLETGHPQTGRFDVSMVGNLRRLKDHLTVIKALELLPPTSKARVLHAGATIDTGLAARLRANSRSGGRYRWLGPLEHERSKTMVASTHLLVHPSKREGGANVVGEALVAGVPVLASRIPGSVGLLGDGHPAYFPVGDARRLADLLLSLERDSWRLARLRARCVKLAGRFHPRVEFESIRRVIDQAAAGV